MISCLKVKKDEGNNQKFFIRNGGLLLEKLVRFCNGRSNPIRHFSAKELLIATNFYDIGQIFHEDDAYRLYKGFIKDLPIIVKKYDYKLPGLNHYNDIVIGSQMSVHKNVLKVLGCCLETKYPAIVYEFAAAKSLSTCISGPNVVPLPWKSRLKIAIDLANAITYLHTAFSRPVIHRDIRCYNILLDENNVPKLTHFGRCISIPEGQSHVMGGALPPKWRKKFTAPETYRTGYLTEKADVYQFGMLLFQLLSGRKPDHLNVKHIIQDLEESCLKSLIDVVDQRITEEGIEVKQLLDFATLLPRCFSSQIEQRPTMMEVAKELRQIHQSFPSTC